MKAICAQIAGKKDRESFILLSGAQRPARQEGAQTRESFFGAGFIQSAKVSDIFIDPESALTAPAPKLTRLTLAHHSRASGTRVKAKTKTSRLPHTRLPASQLSR